METNFECIKFLLGFRLIQAVYSILRAALFSLSSPIYIEVITKDEVIDFVVLPGGRDEWSV
jgi:hypothetical protein